MIILFLIFCVFLVGGAFIYHLATNNSGYFLLVWNQTSYVMDLWFAIVVLVVLLLSLWLLLAVIKKSYRGAGAVKKKLFSKNNEKAQEKTVDGLIDFIEGDWSSARRKLTSSAGKVKAPIINYLAAARSAYEMGEEQKALELLHKAETSTDRGGLAVALTQARMQFANDQYEQTLATLERAAAISPEHPMVLSLRQQAYVALKDWSSLSKLMPKLSKTGVGSTAEHHRLEMLLYSETLKSHIAKQSSLSVKEKQDGLEKVWGAIPSHLQKESSLLSAYVAELMTLEKHDQAEKVLTSHLNKYWCHECVDLYGLLRCSDLKKPLKAAEKWLQKHESDPRLLLAIGRLCVQSQQWGRAKDFLEKSLRLEKRAETYAECGRLYEHMNEQEKSNEYFRNGLLLSANQLSDETVYAS